MFNGSMLTLPFHHYIIIQFYHIFDNCTNVILSVRQCAVIKIKSVTRFKTFTKVFYPVRFLTPQNSCCR